MKPSVGKRDQELWGEFSVNPVSALIRDHHCGLGPERGSAIGGTCSLWNAQKPLGEARRNGG